MTKKLTSIRSLSLEELKSFLEEKNIPKFRSKQIYEWLWKKNAGSFLEMKNIGKNLQEVLSENFSIDKIALKDEQLSNDKTLKCAFSIDEKSVVEGVLIPTPRRMTACISSQVGCSLACAFCATGKLKLLRNLTAGEIYDQVYYLKKEAEKRHDKSLSNIVYMGMGEPLLNYKNVLESINKICSSDGLGMSPKRITVSTAGIHKMIRRLGDDEVKFNLALSLHAANDEKRNKIMEINSNNNLESLKEALEYFHEKTGSRVTFEYIIFDQFNDTIQDARELAEFAKCVPCKINIIEYNPIDGEPFQQAEAKKVDKFAAYLESKNLIVNIRRSRGKDIDAACGQLANKNKAIALENRSLKKNQMIKVEKLTKEFTRSKAQKKELNTNENITTAVENVSFTCNPGEVFSLLGPNGAGKTTTLRMISTIIQPTSGEVEICGIDAIEFPREARMKIGFLTGSTGLYARLNANEIIDYFASLYNVPKALLKERKAYLYDLLDMKGFAHKKIGKLSTGMKQKVSICRTMIHDPEVLIFDEPTSGLDVITAESIIKLIRSCKEQGKTVIFSSHIMGEVDLLSDRLAIIHNGVLKHHGTMTDFRSEMKDKSLTQAFINIVQS